MLRRLASLFIVSLVIFLAACGGQPNQTTLGLSREPKDVSGKWNDYLWLPKLCDDTLAFGVRLDLEQKDLDVTGKVGIISNNSGNSVTESGTFTGTVSEDGKLTGEINLPVQSGTITFKLDAQHEAERLYGTLSSVEKLDCFDSRQSVLSGNIEFITEVSSPVAQDALEPNNAREQAKSLTSGQTIENLTITPGDVDWFSFEVTEDSRLVTFANLRSDFDVKIRLFDDSAKLKATRAVRASGEIEAQVQIAPIAHLLAPGKYYLAVSADNDKAFEGKHAANGKYELMLETEAVPLDKYEPNDTSATATAIELDFSDTLSLYKGDDDWFKFTLGQSGTVVFDVSGAQYDFIYELYNEASATPLFYHYKSAFPTTTQSLTAGTYYLRVYNSYGNMDYPLKVSLQPLPDSAYEPNNSRETAKPINLDFNATLSLSPEDEDWFSFTLAETRLVTLDVVKSGSYNVALLGEQGTDTPQFYEQPSSTIVLKAGKYTLRFYNAFWFQTTTIHVSSKSLPDKALEPNDSLDRATAISFPYKQEGVLLKPDEDYFKFTLTSPQIVTLDLGNIFYNYPYELFAQGQTPMVSYYNGTPAQHPLSAGTYYLHFRSPDYGSTLYLLNMTSQDVPDIAYEPNDSFNNARAITLPFNQDLYFTAGDEDWFKFTVGKEQLLSFGASTLSGYLAAYLYNDQGQQLREAGGFQSGALPAGYLLTPGTYYLKFIPAYYAATAYKASVTVEAVPDATLEPNNSSSQATKIQLGFEKDMLVNGSNDDWFSFTLTETTQVRIALSQFNQGYIAGYLTKSGDINQQPIYSLYEPILAAGTYYIQITSYDTVKYRLSVVRK